MADQKAVEKEPTHPCPICKENGANVLFLKENQIPKQLTKIQQSSILSLPKAIELLVISTELYICRTCGVRYEKLVREDKTFAAARYADEQGREIDPAKMGG